MRQTGSDHGPSYVMCSDGIDLLDANGVDADDTEVSCINKWAGLGIANALPERLGTYHR
jgi:hypothetical protein